MQSWSIKIKEELGFEDENVRWLSLVNVYYYSDFWRLFGNDLKKKNQHCKRNGLKCFKKHV